MKVTLLNPEQVQNIFKEWGNFACECYNTPKQYAEKVGNKCYEDEHFSGSRTEYIKFKIEDVDRGIAEQAMRHEIGIRQNPIDEYTYDENPNNIVKNMKSFRYVDMDNFNYTIPYNISKSSKATEVFIDIMDYINKNRKSIVDILKEEFPNMDYKIITEEANGVLPRQSNTSLCIAFTLEALIHYMHKRLCTRSQYFHRKLAQLMREEILKILPKLKTELVSQCEYLLWCPEKNRCCGKYPTKNELLKRLEINK